MGLSAGVLYTQVIRKSLFLLGFPKMEKREDVQSIPPFIYVAWMG